MLNYSQWKKLNESFAGPIPLGVSSPGSLGVRGGIEGTRIALEEAKKRSKKYADVDDEEGADTIDATPGGEDRDDEGCKFCGKTSKKQAVKKSKKYMGADMDLGGGPDLGGGDDFAAGLPHKKLGKGKPFGKGKHPLHGGDDDLGGLGGGDDDLDDAGGLDDGGLGDDDAGLGDDDAGLGDDDAGLGDDDAGLDDEGGGDLGDDLGGHPHPHRPGGPLNGKSAMHKKPMHPGHGGDDMDMMMKMGMARMKKNMKKNMRKNMRKEAFLHNEDEWLASVKSMMTPQNIKNGDGWTEYQEEALLPPTDPNAAVTQREPQPGEVGFAPQGRVGPPLGGSDGFNEWKKRNGRG